ncbi:MAG: hypothetical protein JWQ11_1696 [Rhizobacter sp.]|nr:hypothetical protein [Rhizobacter sp.]
MRCEPMLIGPPCAGKSTLARLLAERSGRRVVCLDELRHALLPILGCDLERAEALACRGDHAQWSRYVRPFEHRMLEWVLSESSDAVFDVGAGYVLPLDEPAAMARTFGPDDHHGDARLDATSKTAHGSRWLPDSLATCLASFAMIVHVTPSNTAALIERHCVDRLTQRHGRPAVGDGWMLDVARYYARRSCAYSRLAHVEISTERDKPMQSVERIEAFMSDVEAFR